MQRCVFHAEEDAAKRAEFERRFREWADEADETGGILDAAGFIFPRGFAFTGGKRFFHGISFYRARFLGDATFRAIVSSESVDFTRAELGGTLRVTGADVRQSLILSRLEATDGAVARVEVDGSRVGTNLSFTGLDPRVAVSVSGTTILEDVYLSRAAGRDGEAVEAFEMGSASMRDLVVSPGAQGAITLDSLHVRGALAAAEARFRGPFQLDACTVDGYTTFARSLFEKEVQLRLSCHGPFSCRGTAFKAHADLSESGFYGPAVMLGLDLHKGMRLENAYFGDRLAFSTLGHPTGGDIRFHQVAFCGQTLLSHLLLTKEHSLDLSASTFSANVVFSDIHQPKPPEGTAPAAPDAKGQAPSARRQEALIKLHDVLVQPGCLIRFSLERSARPGESDGPKTTDQARPAPSPEPDRGLVDLTGNPPVRIEQIWMQQSDVDRFQIDVEDAVNVQPDDELDAKAQQEKADLFRGLRMSNEREMRHAEAGEFYRKEMLSRERASLARLLGKPPAPPKGAAGAAATPRGCGEAARRLATLRRASRRAGATFRSLFQRAGRGCRYVAEGITFLLLFLYGRISGYGERYLRAFGVLVAWVLVVGASASWPLGGSPSEQLLEAGNAGVQLVLPFDLSPGLNESLGEGVERLHVEPVLVALVRLVGVVLAAFVVVGLRRQFQRISTADA